jgi:hypothetical protein
MPTTITKTKGGKYRVSTPGGTKATSTTKEKAEKQKRLLDAVDHGWEPGEGKPVKQAKRVKEVTHKRKD